jgi:hypothetical protein
MRPWESLSRQGGVSQECPAAEAGARANGMQGSRPPVRSRRRELESQQSCGSRVRSDFPPAPDLGFVRVVAPLGFVRIFPMLWRDRPGSIRDQEFYPISAGVATPI